MNLFAYTGAATISASKAGASEVVHLDAAKGMVNWAKENMALNNLQDHTIRFIVDDALKFVKSYCFMDFKCAKILGDNRR